jgi:hypothetical protein
MADFEEFRRRRREERQTSPHNVDQEVSRSTRRLPVDDIEADQGASTVNPRWRRERISRANERGTTGSMYSYPQEIAVWMQKGGKYLVAAIALVFVALLIFGLIQRTQERQASGVFNDGTPPQDESSVFTTDGEEAVPTAAVSTGEVPGLIEQPTITPGTAPQSPDSAGTGEFFVVVGTGTDGLFMRPEPNTSGAPVATLPEGTRVEQVGEDVTQPDFVWRKVRAPDGTEGWVAIDWLQPAQ